MCQTCSSIINTTCTTPTTTTTVVVNQRRENVDVLVGLGQNQYLFTVRLRSIYLYYTAVLLQCTKTAHNGGGGGTHVFVARLGRSPNDQPFPGAAEPYSHRITDHQSALIFLPNAAQLKKLLPNLSTATNPSLCLNAQAKIYSVTMSIAINPFISCCNPSHGLNTYSGT